MRRKLFASILALAAVTVLAPAAGASPVTADDDGPFICITSKLLLGDLRPICLEIEPDRLLG